MLFWRQHNPCLRGLYTLIQYTYPQLQVSRCLTLQLLTLHITPFVKLRVGKVVKHKAEICHHTTYTFQPMFVKIVT